MSTQRTGPAGAQPTDPPWARLLFLLVQGPDGQCWRAVLLMTPLLLLVTGLVVVMAAVAPVSWVGGAVGVGSLTALAVSRRRTQPRSRHERPLVSDEIGPAPQYATTKDNHVHHEPTREPPL